MTCPAEAYQLSGTASGTNTVSWTTSGDGAFSDATILNPEYTPGRQDILNGSVTLQLESSTNACVQDQDEMILAIEEVKEAEDFEAIILGGEVVLQVLTDDEIAEGMSLAIADEPAHGIAEVNGGSLVYVRSDVSINEDAFTYTLMTPCGESLGAVSLTNNKIPVQVYNVVTPNGDGHHDFLKIENILQYPDNELVIFNRSGKVVYNVNGYDNDRVRFEGLNDKSAELTEGTYYYRLKIPEISLDQSGFLLLKR